MTIDVAAISAARSPRAKALRRTIHVDHFIYRCYDADGVLLYIGCTTDVARRISAHRYPSTGMVASRWLAACMQRHEVEGPFPGREAGRTAELAAIEAERPLFNTYGQKFRTRWMLRSRVGTYLVAHGHGAIAAETTCNCERISERNVVTCPAHGRKGGRVL